jgi:antitoxin VapB
MKTAKLFMNGKSQAVRLPKEFRFEGDEVYIQRLGSTIVLMPKGDEWEGMWAAAERVTDDFMEERDQGSQPEREALD